MQVYLKCTKGIYFHHPSRINKTIWAVKGNPTSSITHSCCLIMAIYLIHHSNINIDITLASFELHKLHNALIDVQIYEKASVLLEPK